MKTLSIHQIIFRTIIAAFCGGMMLSCSNQAKPEHRRLFDHIIIIGFDGMSVGGLQQAATPQMDALIADGAVTYNGRAVMQTSSKPNWSAVLNGAGPEVTGMGGTTWRRDGTGMQPVVKGSDGRFPTLFHTVRAQLPDVKMSAIFQWSWLADLIPEDMCDFYLSTSSFEETTKKVCDYIVDSKPNFLFTHFDYPDFVGHGKGHMTPEYLNCISKCDSTVGCIMESIRHAGMADNTLVMVLSDHGGINKGHGGESPQEITVPVIYWGNGIKKNYEVQEAVYMYDVSPTVAYALGVKIPYAWTGRPVLAAFEGNPEPEDEYYIYRK